MDSAWKDFVSTLWNRGRHSMDQLTEKELEQLAGLLFLDSLTADPYESDILLGKYMATQDESTLKKFLLSLTDHVIDMQRSKIIEIFNMQQFGDDCA